MPTSAAGLGGGTVPKFEQITPILRVRDVEASIAYYTERLGFTDCWQFGEPPSFGGASRDGLEVQFLSLIHI